MAGKPILGRHVHIKLIYGAQTFAFRKVSFGADDNSELRSRSYLGATSEEQDLIKKNYGGSFDVAEDGPALDLVQDDIDALDAANLPSKPVTMTVTKLYRDGTTSPYTRTYTDLVFKVSDKVGGRTEDVSRTITWQAGKRAGAA